MADHRCFTKKITESDEFLDLPHSAQNLYFHLNMYADDRGFISNPRTIMRGCRASDDDAKLLLGKKFILGFEGGIVLVKGWRMHNTIRKDRFHETVYLELLQALFYDENGSYTTRDTGNRVINNDWLTEIQDDNQLTTNCQPTDNQLTTSCHPEVKLSKDKLSKSNISKYKEEVKGETETDDLLIKQRNASADNSEARFKEAREHMARLGLGGYGKK